MRTIRKALILLVAIVLCMAMALPAFAANSNRVVSNVIIVMPPSNPVATATPAPSGDLAPTESLDPEATLDPEEIAETDDALPTEEVPQEEEFVVEAPIPTEVAEPEIYADLPGDAQVHIIAKIRQQGDTPTYGDNVRLISTLEGLEGYDVTLQWQQRKEGGEWFDLANATDTSFSFIMTEENASDAWRLSVVVFASTAPSAPEAVEG